jgi:hypothetical protein
MVMPLTARPRERQTSPRLSTESVSSTLTHERDDSDADAERRGKSVDRACCRKPECIGDASYERIAQGGHGKRQPRGETPTAQVVRQDRERDGESGLVELRWMDCERPAIRGQHEAMRHVIAKDGAACWKVQRYRPVRDRSAVAARQKATESSDCNEQRERWGDEIQAGERRHAAASAAYDERHGDPSKCAVRRHAEHIAVFSSQAIEQAVEQP